MKDLKENIQKNNMKKLVLSVALSMFCYCTNNAADQEEKEKKENLTKIQNVILNSQIRIHNAGADIYSYGKKIYSAIKEEGKVIKKKVLEFITNQFTNEERQETGFQDNIKKIEKYFHLDLKKDDDECKDEDLTEKFWTAPETELEEQGTLTEEEKKLIKVYFNTIIKAENDLSTVFKSYYNAIKTQKEDAKNEDILGAIIKDLCGDEKTGNIVTKFISNLRNLWNEPKENVKTYILTKIKRRITLSNNVQEQENDFISFLKQKIGPQDKKDHKPEEEKKEEEKKSGKPAEEEGGCSCCNDCCEKE